jgi:hypothetical protein
MNIYFKVWVDALTKLKSRPQNAGLWKFYAMVFISMAMALNMIFVLILFPDII